MTQLLNIEQRFVTEQISSHPFLGELTTLTKKLNNAKKNKFKLSLQMSVKCLEAHNWFKKPETKEAMAELGLHWSTADMQLKLFGLQRSFFGKLKKVGQIVTDNPDSVNEFISKVKSFENENGYQPSMSVANFRHWFDTTTLQEEEIDETDAQHGELDESSEEITGEDVQTDSTETESDTICTFTFKDEINGNENVSMRINSNREVIISSGDRFRIVELLRGVIKQVNPTASI